MPKFTDVTQRIQAEWWADDEWVEIRKFGYVDRKYLAVVYVQLVDRLREEGILPPRPESEEAYQKQLEAMPTPPELVAEFNAHTIRQGVRRWTDEHGVMQPVTLEAVRMLSDQDGDFILEAINALNPRRSEEELATFPDGSGDRGADRNVSE